MTNITIGKKELEKIKLLTKEIDVDQAEIVGNKKTKEVCLRFKTSKATESGVSPICHSIVIQQKEVLESFSFVMTDEESVNFTSFVSNASEQEENLTIEVLESNNIKLVVEDVSLVLSGSHYTDIKDPIFLNKSAPSPIVSFSKEDFKSQIVDRTKNLTFQNEWIDKKLAGVNLIVSEDSASIFMATRTFHFKAPITKGVFYPESSKPFVHNHGVMFLSEDFIKNIYSLAEEDEEIKFFLNQSCEEDDYISYDISIGNYILLCVSGYARVKNILNSHKFDDEASSKKVYSFGVNLKKIKKFFTLFKNSEVFVNEVINISSKSGKGLYFKPFEEEEKKFEYFIENKKIKVNSEINANFFVLNSVVQALNGDEIIIMETEANNKHFIISDNSSWFIIGKSIKQE
jgi:hypothetical protein